MFRANKYDLDNKILKYKLKKKKITNKIVELLTKKKKLSNVINIVNIPCILNMMNKINIINDANENANKIKTDNDALTQNVLFYNIIVCGDYSVGKSSLINNVEKILGFKHTGIKINVKSINDLETIVKNINLESIDNESKFKLKINYIEISLEQIERIKHIEHIEQIEQIKQIYKIIQSKNTYIIHVVPSNVNVWKNRIINKFFVDFSKFGDKFSTEQNPSEFIKNTILTKINPQIAFDNFLKTKTSYDDDDFDFLIKELEIPYELAKQYDLMINLNTHIQIDLPNKPTKFYF